MFCIVKEEPDLPVAVGQEDLLQGDHIWMFELSQQLEDTRGQNGVILMEHTHTHWLPD